MSIKIRRSVDIIGPQRRNGMPGAGVEAKMEGCAMLPAIRLVSEAAEFAAHRHTGTARKARADEPYINHLAEVANLLAFVDRRRGCRTGRGRLAARHHRGHRDHARGARAKIRRARCLARRRGDRRHEPVADRAPAKAGRGRPAQIAGRQTDQDRRQDQQYPGAHRSESSSRRSAAISSPMRLGRKSRRRMPRRQCQARCGI